MRYALHPVIQISAYGNSNTYVYTIKKFAILSIIEVYSFRELSTYNTADIDSSKLPIDFMFYFIKITRYLIDFLRKLF